MVYPQLPSPPFGFCALLPIRAEAREKLDALLDRVKKETLLTMHHLGRERALGLPSTPPPPSLIPFERASDLHFARFSILPPGRTGGGETLAFATDFNGEAGPGGGNESLARRRHLEALVAALEPGLKQVLACCGGCTGAESPAEIVALLERHHHRASTLYCGSRGRSRDQIHEEAALRRRVEGFVDVRRRATAPLPNPLELVGEIRTGVEAPPPFPTARSLGLRSILIAVVLGVVAALALVWILFSLWWTLAVVIALAVVVLLGGLLLYYKESTDAVFKPQRSGAERDHIGRASLDEDRFGQNAITHVVDVKPGLFRSLLLDGVFFALRILVVVTFNQGRLGNIPSIHYARWLRFDRRERLLFFSNFDGSWESYLGDFIDQAPSGLTGVWSNTMGYPRSRLLLFAGARQGTLFKAWTRHYQVTTQVWYAAYPGLSVSNVNDNTSLRRALAEPSLASATAVLAKLG